MVACDRLRQGPRGDAMAYILAKTFWLLAKPSNLIVLLLTAGVVLLWLGWHRLGTALVTLGTIPLVALAFLPIGLWLLIPLEDRFPPPEQLPDRLDGIVVLGGAEETVISQARAQPAIGDSAERLTAMVELARHYPEARLLYTGAAASITRALLARQGFDVSRVVFELEARDTYENALFSKKLADPRPEEQWLLVTSARHIPRSVGVFRAVDWSVIPYPVDYRTTGRIQLDSHPSAGTGSRLADLDFAIREWIGLIAYYVMGRTKGLFPSP
jgi:uncharacterized SAM-binding protein YcdF (DUF218 family)